MQSYIVTVFTAAVTASVVTYLLPAQKQVEDSRHATLVTMNAQNHKVSDVKKPNNFNTQSNLALIAELQKKLEFLERKLNTLESNARSANNPNSTDASISETDYLTSDEQMENNSEVEEEDLFENFETSYSNEANNAEWQALMSDSFSRQEELLTQLNIDSIAITQQDCRTNSCMIEYTYTDKDVMNKVKPILIAEHTSQVVFKDIESDGQKKVLAIYRR